MIEKTTYEVEARYVVTDRASRVVGEIEKATKSAAASSSTLKNVLLGLGSGLIAGKIFGGAKHALIDFNANVQEAKNQIAGMLALSKHTGLTEQLGRADKLYDSLQKRAKTLPGTTEEYVTMAGMLTQPIVSAGLGMKALENMTVNTTVAAKALGYEAGLAARDIDQAMRGQFHSTDPFAGKLLGSIGYQGEAGRHKFNQMAAGKRAAEIQRALMQPSISQLGQAQGQTFRGVLSTLQDTMQQFGGKVGVPLFKAITNEIKGWNSWLDKNGRKMDQIAETVGKKLVSAFMAVKDAIAFIYNHADTLITIGKVWAAVKIGGLIGGAFGSGGKGGLVGGVANMFSGAGGMMGFLKRDLRDKWVDSFDKESGAYSSKKVAGVGVMGALGPALQAGLAGYTIANALGLDELGVSIGRWFAGPAGEMANKFDILKVSMAHFDDAMRSAADNAGGKKGVQGSVQYQQKEALVRVWKDGVDAMNDWQRGKYGSGPVGKLQAMERFKSTGAFDDQQLGHMFDPAYRDQLKGSLQYKADELERNIGEAGDAAPNILSDAMGKLTEGERQSIDTDKAAQKVFEMLSQAMARNGGLIGAMAGGLPDEVLKMLQGMAKEDQFGGTGGDKRHVTNVNIARVEVAAKDPDRWIADLDAKVRRRVRAPTRAKRAIAGGM